jgi:pimeloyl-ACP methyl ester carboxylesterase
MEAALNIVRDYITTQDGQLHVRRSGTHRPGTTPLILLHPSPNTSRTYEALLPLLGRGRLAVAIDTPGFGESFRPASKPAIADYARWLAKAPAALGFDRVDVLGQFTGAATASEIARSYPDVVRRLVLAGPPLFTPQQQARFVQDAWPMRPQADGGHLMAEWNRVMSRGLPGVTLEARMDTFVDYYRGGANAIWGEEAVAVYPLREILPQVRQLTLVIAPQGIHGDSEGAFALLPNAALARLEVSGYAMMSTFAPLVAEAVEAFLDADNLENHKERS